MAYRVTAGYVVVDTGEDQTATRVPCGSLLPDDVSQHQIDWELNLGTIEEVPGEREEVPAAEPADDAEVEADADELEAEPEGNDEDPDAGPSVDS